MSFEINTYCIEKPSKNKEYVIDEEDSTLIED